MQYGAGDVTPSCCRERDSCTNLRPRRSRPDDLQRRGDVFVTAYGDAGLVAIGQYPESDSLRARLVTMAMDHQVP
jgi:hypothetical protein